MAWKLTGTKNKSSIFDAKNVTVNVHEDMGVEETKKNEMKPEVRINKVENGYIACKCGGEYNYNEKKLVFKSYDEAVKQCKSFMEGENADKEAWKRFQCLSNVPSV